MGDLMHYNFATLDPRPGADNSAVLGAGTLGIEVTIPALAAQCGLGNIDPQHSGTSSHSAAIIAALDAPLPPAGSTLVTVRPDLDSVGAMAVLELRAGGWAHGGRMHPVIEAIARADAFAYGPWPGIRPIPSTMREWSGWEVTTTAHPYLAAPAALVADRSMPMVDRVDAMMQAIRGKSDERFAPYAARVQAEKDALLASIEHGQTMITQVPGSRICRIISTHVGALDIGYHVAPVVVATNPEMRGPGGVYIKHTVCQWQAGHADLRAAVAALDAAEVEGGGTPGWGGSATIIGSPQGVSSVLSNGGVAAIIEGFIL